MGYIPDDLFFFPSYTIAAMAAFYSHVYPNWNEQRFSDMLASFGLDRHARLARLSKGMQKQAALSLVLSTMPDVLILDEPVDGLDPLVRTKLWNFIMEDVAGRQMTVLVSSHNLDEMENFCDAVGILACGEMKLEGDLDLLREQMRPLSLGEIFLKEMGGESLVGEKEYGIRRRSLP
jgi:ABC-2 type transport system ATP-binding protein